jgi:hypothetical protein
MMMTRRIESFSLAWLLVPDPATAAPLVLDDSGRGIQSKDADATTQRVLQCLGRDVVKTVIVEDDLARRGDVIAGADVAFVEDRVLRWTALDNDAAGAVALMRSGSSGYPLNAFGCVATPRRACCLRVPRSSQLLTD